MTSNSRLLVDPQLCSLVDQCARNCGLVPIAFTAMDSRSSVAQAVRECVAVQPAAVLIDGRAGGANAHPLSQRICNALSLCKVFIIIDETSENADIYDFDRRVDIATIEEVGGGQLAHRLQKLTQGQGAVCGAQFNSELTVTTPEVRCGKRPDNTIAMVSLNQIAIEMMNRVELPSLLQNIADYTGALSRADYAYVAMVHESGDYLETIAVNSDSLNLKDVRHKRGEGIGGQAWLRAETICVPDYQGYAYRLPGLTRGRQACSVPLRLSNVVIGVIGILYESDDIDVDGEVDMLEMFAPLASVAIDNARLHENTRMELSRTRIIGEISRAIYGTSSFDSIINRICTALIEVFDASKAHIYKLENDNTLNPLAAWELIDGEIVPSQQSGSAVVARSIAQWCIENQKTGFVKRGVNDPRESEEVHRVRAGWRLGSTICLPLVYEDKSWGVLFAHRAIDRTDFKENEINLFELIGAQISVALLRRELMEKVQYQAYHDSLTGVANRFSFEGLLENAVSQAEAAGDWFAVMFIDLDGFKAINDSHGHRMGDKLLKQVTAKISMHLNREDVLGRMGGDEFALIVSNRENRAEVTGLAQTINNSLTSSMLVDNLRAVVGASIGLSFYPSDATTAEEMLKYADFAMYHAKSLGKGGFSVFDRSHLDFHEKQISLEHDLRRAVEAAEFELHYQPKINNHTGRVDGVEALIRWVHPTLGFVPPSEFIPVAERCGLIEVIGAWVLDESCRQCAELQRQGMRLSVAVNISAQQFIVDDFVQQVFSTVRKYDVPPELIELEVTESVVMKDVSIVVEKLAELRCGGITIAIDDFGTGYSSLQYLADLPLDVLKIDKSFIDKVCTEGKEKSLVKTIVLMARELQLGTVAEGVETEQQVQALRKLGCDYSQGYYYSKPVPGKDLQRVVADVNKPDRCAKAA